MIIFILICLILIITYYYELYNLLMIVNVLLIFYSVFLYFSFYDNSIIANWISEQNIDYVEKLDFDIKEFNMLSLYNIILYSILGILLGIIIYKIYILYSFKYKDERIKNI